MPINLVIAVTDGDWFDMLRQRPNLEEVNFWAPTAASFRALKPGELFLFKLHAPRREANGARSAQEIRTRIARYRRLEPNDRTDFEIGCRILTQPFLTRTSGSVSRLFRTASRFQKSITQRLTPI